MKKSIVKEACGQSPRRLTPQQQLWELIDVYQQDIIRKVFRRLKKRDQEDLCYSMVAYIRFGILRDFPCPFLQTLFLSFVDLVDGKLTNKMLNTKNS